jgi:hypothetical protein
MKALSVLKAQLDRSELRLTSLKQHDLSDASLDSEKEALDAEDEDFWVLVLPYVSSYYYMCPIPTASLSLQERVFRVSLQLEHDAQHWRQRGMSLTSPTKSLSVSTVTDKGLVQRGMSHIEH